MRWGFCHIAELSARLFWRRISRLLRRTSPLLAQKKTRQKWGTHQGLDFDAAVSQTRSDAAGPSEIVPSGVVSVRV